MMACTGKKKSLHKSFCVIGSSEWAIAYSTQKVVFVISSFDASLLSIALET